MTIIYRFSKSCHLISHKNLLTAMETAKTLFHHVFLGISAYPRTSYQFGGHISLHDYGEKCTDNWISMQASHLVITHNLTSR